MERTPTSVTATLLLIILIAIFWLVFAVIVLIGAHPSLPSEGIFKWIMLVLALGTSIVLAGLVILLRKRIRLAFYFGVVVFATIAVLSITDQIGWSDLAMLVINLVTLGLLIKDRAWYLRSGEAAPKPG